MKKRIRRPILIAAAGIAGILTLVAGYVESQAAARFAFEVASVRPQPLAQPFSDDQVEAPAPTTIPLIAKAHQPAKVHSAAKPKAESDDTFVEHTEVPVESHIAAEISRIQSNILTHADIESLKLLASLAQERFPRGLRLRVMQDRTGMPGDAEKSDGN